MERMREHRDEVVGKAVMDLPTPPASEDFFANVLGAIGRGSRRHRLREARWRPILLAGAVITVSLVVGAVAGAVLAKPSKDTTAAPGTWFQPAPGWNTVVTNEPGPEKVPIAWAANVPFKSESLRGEPDNTIESLPPDGIVIVFVGPWVYTGDEPVPQLKRLPPELSDFYFAPDNYEGQLAPNVSAYHIAAHVNEKEIINIYVWMGTTQPTKSMIDAANEELARLSLPS